jgi:hypothetical protein
MKLNFSHHKPNNTIINVYGTQLNKQTVIYKGTIPPLPYRVDLATNYLGVQAQTQN